MTGKQLNIVCMQPVSGRLVVISQTATAHRLHYWEMIIVLDESSKDLGGRNNALQSRRATICYWAPNVCLAQTMK